MNVRAQMLNTQWTKLKFHNFFCLFAENWSMKRITRHTTLTNNHDFDMRLIIIIIIIHYHHYYWRRVVRLHNFEELLNFHLVSLEMDDGRREVSGVRSKASAASWQLRNCLQSQLFDLVDAVLSASHFDGTAAYRCNLRFAQEKYVVCVWYCALASGRFKLVKP